jgi:hypothetical protein
MKKNKIIILLIVLIFYFLIKVEFFRHLHEVVLTKHEKRMTNVYGFCLDEGIGFINFIRKKYKIKEEIRLINPKKGSHQWAIYNTDHTEEEKNSAKHWIIINYTKVKDEINLNDFEIINNIDDCYYLIKND